LTLYHLDPDKPTWLGLDLSPDRKHAALVAAQKLSGERFYLQLLHTWSNDYSLNDLAIANDLAPYARKYNVQTVAYTQKNSSSGLPVRLVPQAFQLLTWMGRYMLKVAIDG
jgi:hypothetical protein